MADSHLSHILDNPIWNALRSGNRQKATQDLSAAIIDRAMGAFAGLEKNSPAAWENLYELIPSNDIAVLFSANTMCIPTSWGLLLEKPLLQLVYPGSITRMPNSHTSPPITTLTDDHIPAMLELTALTKPGPFLHRTIDFGNYQGIYEGQQLVAMAGQRFSPLPYVEISAVCTHPGAAGKGYAKWLLSSQVNAILANGGIPFLHVYPDNLPAVGLYRSLGFEIRRDMFVYVVQRL